MPIEGVDHIEFYTSNALQSAYYYKAALGFESLAYSGLETGNRSSASYVVQQGKIRFVFTTPLDKGSAIGQHIDVHGDGVKRIALTVPDARASFEETVKRGAVPYLEPTVRRDSQGEVVLSGIRIYGDTVHVFVERSRYAGDFLPSYQPWTSAFKPAPIGLKYVDHTVGNTGWGEMRKWADFYREVMGFTQLISFDDKDISTDYTALMSKVMTNDNGRIKFPINEPAKGRKKSQIEEYVEFYNGAGVQHIAMATDDIYRTVSKMAARGVEFLHIPDDYYDTLSDRVGVIDEDMERLKALRILVDRDEEGYLLQLFTKPVEPRPTLFFEIIQRKGARSFGKGNFKALFQAIEREQARRGTL